MANVILVAYLLIVLALIGVILVQRSEGGGLGIGGGTAGGMMTARGSANLLTRTTSILAALFMATAIGLTIINEIDRGSNAILDQATQGAKDAGTAEGGANTTTQQPKNVLDALNKLQGEDTSSSSASGATPATGTSQTPSAEAAPASSDSQSGLDLPVPTSSTPAADGTGTGSTAPSGTTTNDTTGTTGN